MPTVCEPCPAPAEVSVIAKDEDKECQHRIKLYERENERLRLEPERLQEDFHRQSQEIWRLRAEVAAAKRPGQKPVPDGEGEDSWVERAKAESTQLRTDLSACQEDLEKAHKVQEQMLKLVSS